jgi:hypothetical protein
MNTPFSNITFPSRKSILENNKTPELDSSGYIQKIVEDAQKIDLDKIDFSNEGNFKPRSKIVEKQKEYFWIRIYLEHEANLKQEDKIIIKDLLYDEELEVEFMFWGKKYKKGSDGRELTEFDPEDDKKCAVLMVDSIRVNTASDDIPYIRTLFPLSRWFRPNYIKREDLQFIPKKTGIPLEYYSVDF